MAIDYIKLGSRIGYLRRQKGISQDDLAVRTDISRESISTIESGKKSVGLGSLVDIANALGVSADDLLVDSLEYPVSVSGSEIHRLLLDCNKLEEEILIRTVKELKTILYGLGV